MTVVNREKITTKRHSCTATAFIVLSARHCDESVSPRGLLCPRFAIVFVEMIHLLHYASPLHLQQTGSDGWLRYPAV